MARQSGRHQQFDHRPNWGNQARRPPGQIPHRTPSRATGRDSSTLSPPSSSRRRAAAKGAGVDGIDRLDARLDCQSVNHQVVPSKYPSRNGRQTATHILQKPTDKGSLPSPRSPHGPQSTSPRPRRSKRELRDHVLRLLKKPAAPLAMLGASQHALKAFLKFRPAYEGGRFFHAGKLGSTIASYRCFHNIGEWLSIYDMAKDQRATGLKGDKPNLILDWIWNGAYGGYLLFEGLCYLGMAQVLKLSRDADTHGRRCLNFDRYSCQFWAATMVIKAIQHIRESRIDKRLRKERERRAAMGETHLNTEDDATFYEGLKKRRAKRIRQSVINAAWSPGALHWCWKNSPLDPRVGNFSAIAAQLSKVYFFWREVKPG